MLVCGAAISTHFSALAGRLPSTCQPLARRNASDRARRAVLTTGVVKMVRCMGVSEVTRWIG